MAAQSTMQHAVDQEEEKRKHFRAAWTIVRNTSRKTRRFVSRNAGSAVDFAVKVMLVALLLAALATIHYVLVVGLVGVFAIGSTLAWWLAVIPSFMILTSVLKLLTEIKAVSNFKKAMDEFGQSFPFGSATTAG